MVIWHKAYVVQADSFARINYLHTMRFNVLIDEVKMQATLFVYLTGCLGWPFMTKIHRSPMYAPHCAENISIPWRHHVFDGGTLLYGFHSTLVIFLPRKPVFDSVLTSTCKPPMRTEDYPGSGHGYGILWPFARPGVLFHILFTY